MRDLVEMCGNGAGHTGLKALGGQAPGGGVRPFGDEPVGDVVAITSAGLQAMGGGQAIACLVSELSNEESGLRSNTLSSLPSCSALQFGLNAVPEFVINQGWMAPGGTVRGKYGCAGQGGFLA